MTTPDLLIDHLRFKDPDESPAALKLGLQQALRQVRFHPVRLPPHVVLVIRRLQSQASFGLDAPQMYDWQRQVQSQIDDLAKQAYRPGKQYVPINASSVLFYDDVELLVCFTRDTLAHRTTWYWAELFPSVAYPGQDVGFQLLAGWETYPQAIPHALVDLKPHETRNALSSLNSNQLSRLAHLLHQTIALRSDVLESAVPDPIPSQQETTSSHIGKVAVPDLALPAAPWHNWLPPQLYQHLSPQAEYILGLCHTLIRCPQQARQPRFAQETRQWLEQTAFRPKTNPIPEPQISTIRPNLSDSITGDLPRQSPNHSITQSPEPDHSADLPLPEGTYTSLGGALFLINLLTHLQLPGIVPGLEALNPWELLGALTADLLGEQLSLHQTDPLWQVFNTLAGLEPREKWGTNSKWQMANGKEEEGDEGGGEEGLFYLLPEWFGMLPGMSASLRLERQNSRQRLWDTAVPILIADLPDTTDALETLVALYEEADISMTIEPQPGWTEIKTADNPFTTSNLSWYVARIRPFLITLLEYLTGETAETILHRPATIYLSHTHIDLCLSLEQISISLRRAGLDRSPGWLPGYGYIVTIFFD
ncbi:MAG: hypothetical protein WAM60_05165 [Candidatus Promineifilaceae bacterium]